VRATLKAMASALYIALVLLTRTSS
jgi:hypothetical protein